jgi:hypothetical protein
VCKADDLPPYCAVVKKSGSLNFPEPSGPARPVMGELYLLAFCRGKGREVKGSYFSFLGKRREI